MNSSNETMIDRIANEFNVIHTLTPEDSINNKSEETRNVCYSVFGILCITYVITVILFNTILMPSVQCHILGALLMVISVPACHTVLLVRNRDLESMSNIISLVSCLIPVGLGMVLSNMNAEIVGFYILFCKISFVEYIGNDTPSPNIKIELYKMVLFILTILSLSSILSFNDFSINKISAFIVIHVMAYIILELLIGYYSEKIANKINYIFKDTNGKYSKYNIWIIVGIMICIIPIIIDMIINSIRIKMNGRD